MQLAKIVVATAALGGVLGGVLGGIVLAALAVHAEKETVGVLPGELWDGRTGTWSAAGALEEELVAPELVALGDGDVLVVGGYSGSTPGLELFWWRPGTHRFEAAWSPEIATDCRTALPLADGRILFSSPSEEYNFGIGVNHAEIWDPRTRQGTTVVMAPDRGVRATAPLADQRVLFVFASGAAIWDPRSLAWTGLESATKPGSPALDCTASARALPLAGGRVLVVSKLLRAGTEWAWIWEPANGGLVHEAGFEHAITAAAPAALAEETALRTLTLSPKGEVVLLTERAAYVAAPSLATATATVLPPDREGAATAIVGRRLLVAGGGRDGVASDGAVTLDLDRGAVARTGAMAAARTGAGAVALPDGRVLVVGGSRERWDVTWGGFVALGVLVLLALGLLWALRAVARRSGRGWVVLGVAFTCTALVAGGAILFLVAVAGSAIKG